MLELAARVRAALLAHAREGAPEEVCGVLGGPVADDDATVTASERVPNVAASPRTRYELDPEAQFAAMEALADAGEVVGFYHSHPEGPARPSATDVAQAAWPGYRYVIVSLGGEPSVGSWVWNGEGFRAEDLRVVE